jgi:hypothetical protein
MKIVFQAMAMVTGVLLVAGVIGLVLLNQVLEAWPMRTPPVSKEDRAVWRNAQVADPETAPQS